MLAHWLTKKGLPGCGRWDVRSRVHTSRGQTATVRRRDGVSASYGCSGTSSEMKMFGAGRVAASIVSPAPSLSMKRVVCPKSIASVSFRTGPSSMHHRDFPCWIDHPPPVRYDPASVALPAVASVRVPVRAVSTAVANVVADTVVCRNPVRRCGRLEEKCVWPSTWRPFPNQSPGLGATPPRPDPLAWHLFQREPAS
jgi:hypothetical protein